ncbi:hypothetical protein [Motilibacter aurantiacus]|uniref:hypothetical protein n=1 Tax=Motilibacter aurantiacus TaxID=2714955 RepID=UPI001408242D|nr:hypothetical protein [Motilibacter aurantiacus]NHC46934.1 hypothetical protein [Motilibacter aurantiacus]
MTPPPPRPALSRGTDGSARPAPARLAPFPARLPAARDTRHDRPTADPAPPSSRRDEEIVELRVRMPRSTRKALRVRAEAAGYTAEDAAYHLVRSWLQQ